MRSSPAIRVVIGKGGVGKTTTAAALALASARPTRLLSLDPAHSVADVLPDPPTDVVVDTLDGTTSAQAFLDNHRPELSLLADASVLRASTARALLALPAPPAAPWLALFEVERALADGTALVLDLPPTGHGLALLDAASELEHWLLALQTLDARRRALPEHYGTEVPSVTPLLRRLRQAIDAWRNAWNTGDIVVWVVTTDQPMVQAETHRLLETLRQRGAVVRVLANGGGHGDRFAPRLPSGPVGATALQNWRAGWRRTPWPDTGDSEPASLLDALPAVPVTPRLSWFCGKGGVGKTTLASAWALTRPHPVLLLSTDPAHSLGDALDRPLQASPVRVTDQLWAAELDAQALWQRVQRDLREDLGNNALSLPLDRAVLESLWDLAPPGLSEWMALQALADHVQDPRFTEVIVDPAPTGHLLALLSAPALLESWLRWAVRATTDVAGLISLPRTRARVLHLLRGLRPLRRLLTSSQCHYHVVCLDEPVVQAETARLERAFGSLGVAPVARWLNRTSAQPRPDWVRVSHGRPPVGLEALSNLVGGACV